VRLGAPQPAAGLDVDQHRCDLQQRVGGGWKPPVSTSMTTGRKPRKRRTMSSDAARGCRQFARRRRGRVYRSCGAPCSRQAIGSPARSGTSNPAPKA
jgi:hypothetical protein